MPNWQIILIVSYLTAISFMAVILAVSDKRRAIKHKRRIPEATLMTVGLLGGALPMYITMRVVHHKTLHKKFMLGLPAELLLHIIIVCFILYILVF